MSLFLLLILCVFFASTYLEIQRLWAQLFMCAQRCAVILADTKSLSRFSIMKFSWLRERLFLHLFTSPLYTFLSLYVQQLYGFIFPSRSLCQKHTPTCTPYTSLCADDGQGLEPRGKSTGSLKHIWGC